MTVRATMEWSDDAGPDTLERPTQRLLDEQSAFYLIQLGHADWEAMAFPRFDGPNGAEDKDDITIMLTEVNSLTNPMSMEWLCLSLKQLMVDGACANFGFARGDAADFADVAGKLRRIADWLETEEAQA